MRRPAVALSAAGVHGGVGGGVVLPGPAGAGKGAAGGSPVTWNDLRSFFAGMEMGESAGGEDGFTLLLRSTRNEQLLRELAARPDEPQAHAIAGDTP